MSCYRRTTRGLGDFTKRRTIFRALHERLTNNAFVQETHSTNNNYKKLRNEWGGKAYFDHSTSNSKGVAIFCDRNLDFELKSVEKSGEGRWIILDTKIKGKEVAMINVYAPNEDDPLFFATLFNKIQKIHADLVIVGGDLNVTLDNQKDRKSFRSSVKDLTKSAKKINSFLEEREWCDVWRVLNPDELQFTWKRKDPLIMSRLDYFMVPYENLNSIGDCQIVNGVLSDHHFVEMTILVNDQIQGRGYWKFNTSLLKNKEYVEQVNEIIDKSLFTHRFKDPCIRWEILKIEVTTFSQSFSKRIAYNRKEKIKEYDKKIMRLKKKLTSINLQANNVVSIIEETNLKIDSLKQKLQKEHDYATQGAILRSKSRFYEMGEHSSKYFFSLEKRNGRSRSMSMVYDLNNKLQQNPVKIFQTQADFYEKLYTKDEKIKFQISRLPERRISDETKSDLEKEITMEELGIALKQMKNSKSPGLDGIPADWLKVFFVKIKGTLLEVFRQSFQLGCLYESARRGVISLIPKKLRDLRKIHSWRPIILLCVDYKVLAKIISNRVKNQFIEIIHPDQSAFLPGRNISNAIRKVVDTIRYADQRKINALLISIDFEKAFDRVDYEALFEVFRTFNFGTKMIAWIRLLFTNFSLCTVNGGHFSRWFTPTRGLFQGNPFSCYGFLAMIEIFAIMIRNNQEIHGIQVKNLQSLLSLFADDVNLFIKNSEKAWCSVQDTIKTFEGISGLKVNYEKSTIYRLGSARGSIAKFYSAKQLTWTDSTVEILGITIHEEEGQMMKLNIDPLFEKAESILTLIRIWTCF